MSLRGKQEQQRLLERGPDEGEELSPTDDGGGLELDFLSRDHDEQSPGQLPSPRWKQRRRRLWRLPHFHLPRYLQHFHGPRIPITVLAIIVLLILVCPVFFPSYSNPPHRYTALRARVQKAPRQAGRANVDNEKIFVAAALYDRRGKLLSGDWAASMLGLIHVLGPDNVYLSIYENDADEESKRALTNFEKQVTCQSTIIEEELDTSAIAHVLGAGGVERMKRMAFLAEVRNRALKPLQDPASPASHIRFDRLLYVNDVIFDPVDAANLLFSTRPDKTTGRPQYLAACATDFINPLKFYDTFATRDYEGYNMGVPFYPWFTGAGKGISRRDVLSQQDAVRVRSCWGGIVAFDARWFLSSNDNNDPLRFRAVNDTYWDASECCLINADLTELALKQGALNPGESGIFMNPYVRVAYSKPHLSWLALARRFERLYTPVHSVVNWIAGRPSFNPRRLELPGTEVTERVWTWDSPPNERHGSFQSVTRLSTAGSFCGQRGLWYIDEKPTGGKRGWAIEMPPDR
jgi:hypothetical protein